MRLCCVENAIAVAMSAVLQKKYAPAAPSSGFAIAASGMDASPVTPPSM
jgi:hypothetical protein